jgi:hypothetical protein
MTYLEIIALELAILTAVLFVFNGMMVHYIWRNKK